MGSEEEATWIVQNVSGNVPQNMSNPVTVTYSQPKSTKGKGKGAKGMMDLMQMMVGALGSQQGGSGLGGKGWDGSAWDTTSGWGKGGWQSGGWDGAWGASPAVKGKGDAGPYGSSGPAWELLGLNKK